MSRFEVTAEEVARTINGFEDIAIEQQFGSGYQTMTIEKRHGAVGRALCFVQLKRDGVSDKDAFKEVMSMTLEDFVEFFAESEPPEVDPDEPITESGKEHSSPDSATKN